MISLALHASRRVRKALLFHALERGIRNRKPLNCSCARVAQRTTSDVRHTNRLARCRVDFVIACTTFVGVSSGDASRRSAGDRL